MIETCSTFVLFVVCCVLLCLSNAVVDVVVSVSWSCCVVVVVVLQRDADAVRLFLCVSRDEVALHCGLVQY